MEVLMEDHTRVGGSALFGRYLAIVTEDFYGLIQSSQTDARTIPQSRARLLPSTSFPIHVYQCYHSVLHSAAKSVMK
jgi:hypothetical protein